jgi:hypothetical protein
MTITKKVVTRKVAAKKTTSPTPTRTIHKVNADQIKDVYIDGMSNLVAGPSIAKISFYSTISASETEETRMTALTLVMSTDVMIDIVAKLRSSIMTNEETLKTGLDSHKKKSLDSVDKLKRQ